MGGGGGCGMGGACVCVGWDGRCMHQPPPPLTARCPHVCRVFLAPSRGESYVTILNFVNGQSNAAAQGMSATAISFERTLAAVYAAPVVARRRRYSNTRWPNLGRRPPPRPLRIATSPPSVRVQPTPILVPTGVDAPTDSYAWLRFGGRWGQKEAGFEQRADGAIDQAPVAAPDRMAGTVTARLECADPGCPLFGPRRHRLLLRSRRGGLERAHLLPAEPAASTRDPGGNRGAGGAPSHAYALVTGPDGTHRGQADDRPDPRRRITDLPGPSAPLHRDRDHLPPSRRVLRRGGGLAVRRLARPRGPHRREQRRRRPPRRRGRRFWRAHRRRDRRRNHGHRPFVDGPGRCPRVRDVYRAVWARFWLLLSAVVRVGLRSSCSR